MPSLTDAYNFCVAACNDPYIGYSIPKRTTIQLGVTYRTYCDCSSLMARSLVAGGYFPSGTWFDTAHEVSYLTRAGWQEVPQTGTWLPGDILWYPAGFNGHTYGHTEMVHTGGNGHGITMGAHTSGVTFANQVCINSSDTYAGHFQKMFRDVGSSVLAYRWHQSNSYLSLYGDDMTANAYMVFSYFSALGFTDAAIAGLLGNFQQESTINPGLWQNLTPGTGGYGLMQSTPASKYFNYASAHNIDTNEPDENGDGQCAYVNDGPALGEWLPGSGYSYTWAEFAKLKDYREATRAFLYQYERAGDAALANRLAYAEHWYNQIKNGYWNADWGTPPPNTSPSKYPGWITELQRRLVIPGRH